MKCKECGSLVGTKSSDIFWFPDQWKVVTQYGEIILTGKLEYSIFNLLWSNQGICGLNGEVILDRIFYNDLNGGCSLSTLRQRMCRLRKQVKKIGLVITQGKAAGYGLRLKGNVK